ncbi:hypothetical protein FB451DRAFT_1193854 [Mycena latifolia]|nr:hypothetical protein FB451DRAFT_1193854 [Mycena latifolia]
MSRLWSLFCRLMLLHHSPPFLQACRRFSGLLFLRSLRRHESLSSDRVGRTLAMGIGHWPVLFQQPLQPSFEVFAVDGNHPETVNFMRVWGVMGIKPDSHFVLAFVVPTNPVSPSSRDYSLSPFPDIPPANFGDQLTPATTFIQACAVLGLSAADVESARFKSSTYQDKQLVAMVQNWTSAGFILAKFWGFSITLNSILGELGWTKSSYNKKAKWFPWAARAATLFWHELLVPTEGDSAYELYRIWRGICFIWKAGGPIATGILPSKSSTDPDEKDAAALTQQTIESSKVKLSECLVDAKPTA